tara:strand:- start:10875 stop:11009 length:135 start_codon:yes stop_codon:yes gene_type:complete
MNYAILEETANVLKKQVIELGILLKDKTSKDKKTTDNTTTDNNQ